MAEAPLRLGVLTAGGDVPGMNAAIRAVVRRAAQFRCEVVGIRNGWHGLYEADLEELGPASVSGILSTGGSILGTSRFNPFIRESGPERVLVAIQRERLDAVVVIGGRDSLSVAAKLSPMGAPLIGIPKTINNDVYGTDYSIGFDTATTTVSDALDTLTTTASAHSRVIVVEVMGRKTGWIGLVGGLAGGADFIMVPEVPTTIASACDHLSRRVEAGHNFSIIVVAEGARVTDLSEVGDLGPTDEFGNVRLDRRSLGELVAKEIEKCSGLETRTVVLGHLQRAGRPTVFDRVLASRLGVFALDLARQGKFGMMACLLGSRVVASPLSEVLRGSRLANIELYDLAKVFF